MAKSEYSVLDVDERAREKARARAADQRDLAEGKKSRAQLRDENGAFAFPRSRVRLDLSKTRHG
jgi:hypothetical protein